MAYTICISRMRNEEWERIGGPHHILEHKKLVVSVRKTVDRHCVSGMSKPKAKGLPKTRVNACLQSEETVKGLVRVSVLVCPVGNRVSWK